MSLMEARMIHVGIALRWQEVYAFAADPQHLVLWASGLAAGLEQDGEDWIGDGGPTGRIRIRFAPPNAFGILDHTVTMPDGTVVANPMRVIANGEGAEVVFTLFRRKDQDNAALEADAAHILRDLQRLKEILEQSC